MSNARKLSPHEIHCLAAVASVDPRTARNYLADPARVRSKSSARLARALTDLGLDEDGVATADVDELVSAALKSRP
jgi:hypothetical protein